jgi:2-polyprenyl-6-methoxyphenol hydroxylase-like FAD-dependent oxidoreductase
VQARSLEIYRQMGVINRVLSGGKRAQGVSFNREGKNIASFSLANVGEGQTPYPFIELYPQSKNERLLLDYLTQNCCPVYWESNLISLKQAGQKVEVQIESHGQTSTIACDWLIGADGAHSAVRKHLNIPFTGDTYPHVFYLADVELSNTQLPDNQVSLYMSGRDIAGFFPMPETNRYRVLGNLPDNLDKQKSLKLEDITPHLNAVCKFELQIVKTFWFTDYRLHHRMADKFREQRCFLIGDAAHIHSPVGAQGMNTGLQDAYNLAWKLAGVINSQIDTAILDSYSAERMPVARRLLSTTDRIFTVIMGNNLFIRLFKKWLLPGLLKFVWSKASLREVFFKLVSQVGISYRDSAINLHISQATKVKAGDRLPYLKIFDEKKEEQTDLHEWCSKPGFTLIVLGKLTELDLFTLAKWITQNYAANLNFFYLPPSAKNQKVFDAFEIKKGQAKSLIVRPDMHIGFINDKVDTVLMGNYLKNVVGVVIKSTAQRQSPF